VVAELVAMAPDRVGPHSDPEPADYSATAASATSDTSAVLLTAAADSERVVVVSDFCALELCSTRTSVEELWCIWAELDVSTVELVLKT